MPVAPDHLRAGEDLTNNIQRTGKYKTTVAASYTRPADTTAYATGDVVCNSTTAPVVLTFTGMARANAGTGRIVGARLISDSAAGTKGDFELHLFDLSTVTIQNDNAAWAPTDAHMLNEVGPIAFGSAPYVGSGNEIYRLSEGAGGLPLAFKCAAADANLYGILVVRSAYTPANAGVITIELEVEQD